MQQPHSIKVEIESKSGFCFGVVKAIKKAESELSKDETLFCLGEIVHNSEEVNRLESLGLRTITHSDLKDFSGKKVLLRAHGEPPETYQILEKLGVKVIDASCPVVLKLQEKVHRGWCEMQKVGGQVLIFGKKGHAEVVGLIGQTNGKATVIERIEDLDMVDFSKPIELFSQTTMSREDYQIISETIRKRMSTFSSETNLPLFVHNSICGQVSNRKKDLKVFSGKHDIILFVSGKTSSNGKVLYSVCKQENPNTFFISNPEQINPKWFEGISSVGICGATSTPRWLLEKVEQTVKNLTL